MWLHVDAAYGGFASLTARGRAALAGIELADSVTLDPHKWLYQPIECGCLLVREGSLLADAFTINPDYLADYKSEAVNFADLGLQLTRGARALKIWLSFNYLAWTRSARRSIARSTWRRRPSRRSTNRRRWSCCRPRRWGSSASVRQVRRRRRRAHDRAQLNSELVRAFEATGRGLSVLHQAFTGPLRHPAVRDEPHQRSSRREGALHGSPPHHGLPRPRTPTSGSSRTAARRRRRWLAADQRVRPRHGHSHPALRRARGPKRSTSCSAPPASLRWSGRDIGAPLAGHPPLLRDRRGVARGPDRRRTGT